MKTLEIDIYECEVPKELIQKHKEIGGVFYRRYMVEVEDGWLRVSFAQESISDDRDYYHISIHYSVNPDDPTCGPREPTDEECEIILTAIEEIGDLYLLEEFFEQESEKGHRNFWSSVV